MSKNSKRSDSELSVESIGLGAVKPPVNVDLNNLPKPIEFSISKLEAEGGSPAGEIVFNCIAFIIYCEKHRQIALSYNERSKAMWMPFVACSQNKTWNDGTMDGIAIVFSKDDPELDARLTTSIPVKSVTCLHMLRVQLPITQKFAYRLIQLIRLANNTEIFKCCQNTKRLQWIGLEDAIAGNVPGLWGPEVPQFASFIIESQQQEIFEYGLDQAYFYVPKKLQTKVPEEKMLQSLNVGIKQVEKIYSDYLEHCFPSIFMTFTSFISYMSEYIKLRDAVFAQLFSAFNFNRNGYLGFHEFLLGIISIEPGTVNNEARLKLVYRYYDTTGSKLVKEAEFSNMLADLNLNIANYRHLFEKSESLSLEAFVQLAISGTLRGTEALCRSPTPIVEQICKNFSRRSETRISACQQSAPKDPKPDPKDGGKGVCLGCRDKRYDFGSHCVRLDPNGRCVEPRHILEYDDGDRDEQISKLGEISMYKYSQDYVFSTVSIGHTFIDMIRDFNNDKGTASKPIGFLANHELHDTFISYLNILCQNVRSLMECEEKLVKINSPVFVIGDIRGNIEELLLMENILWQSIPVVPNNFVFLGNYVNIGKWSLECILYVFALKIIAPNKFFLIRGVNETRSNQKNGFYQECTSKYGNKHGLIIYNVICDVFNRMCLAVVVDESVLCLNNNIPGSPNLEDIYKIVADLKEPSTDPIAKEMLSNTPCSDDATVEYLKRNNLSHLIKANQILQEGYEVTAGGKCINLFSTSKYLGKNNQSAIACVDRPKIRLIKLDTSKCQPSTDP